MKYRIVKEGKEKWIQKPNNGGDVGDMMDIVDELNYLYDRMNRLEQTGDRMFNGITRPEAERIWKEAKR